MLDIERWTRAQIRGIAGKLAEDLHDSTPIKTGFARSNWVAGFSVIETTVGSKEGVDSSRYVSSLAAIATWNPLSNATLYISNPVPYMGRLNNGWSSQAPSGFIEAAIERAQASAEWPV